MHIWPYTCESNYILFKIRTVETPRMSHEVPQLLLEQTYHSLKAEEDSGVLDVIQFLFSLLLEIHDEMSAVGRWW